MRQFDQLRASELFCSKCRTAQPVRERLLLVLPHSELHDYRCTVCGTSVGSREVRQPPVPLNAAAVPAPAARGRGAPPGPRRMTVGRRR